MLVNKTGLLEHIMTQLIETKSRLHGLGLPDHQVEKINFPLKNASSKLYDFYLGYKSEIETNEHLQKGNEYWKQRCLAAEDNIKTYSEWHTDELTCDHIHENASKTFAAWETAFKKWQQLKNQRVTE